MDPVEYLNVLRRRWPLVVLAVLLALAAAWLTTPTASGVARDPAASSYQATHTLLRDDLTATDNPLLSPGRLQLFATTGEIPLRVAQRLGIATEPALLAAQVQVAHAPEVGTISVTVRDENRERATQLADAFAAELMSYFGELLEERRQAELALTLERMRSLEERVRELSRRVAPLPVASVERTFLEAELTSVQRIYQAASDRHQQLLSQGSATIGYSTMQAALPVPVRDEGFQVPQSPQSRLVFAAIVGLLLGVGLAFVIDRADTRIRSRYGAEREYGLPVVAEVPSLSPRLRRKGVIVTIASPGSPAAEAFRMLRLSLQLMPRWVLPRSTVTGGDLAPRRPEQAQPPQTGSAKTVLVTSANAGEGKTTTAVNLAAGFAESGNRVLVLDCDFRGGDLHEHFRLTQRRGVREFLEAKTAGHAPELDSYLQGTEVPGVRVMTHGATSDRVPVELLHAGQTLLRAAAQTADVVLIDAGPILAVNDTAALIPAVDDVVVVCRAGRTTAEAAQRTSEMLGRVAAPVIGVVLVGGSGDVPSHSWGRSRPRGDQSPILPSRAEAVDGH